MLQFAEFLRNVFALYVYACGFFGNDYHCLKKDQS